jgi:D-alanyl-D-alanine carboxypeptidase (penicillin-binding protein 5/6)
MRRIFCFLLSICFVFCSLLSVNVSGAVVKENEDVPMSETFTVSAQNKKDLEKLPIEIKAKAAILIDALTGTVLLEYNPDLKLYPASVTKIMTMLLVAEAISSKKIALTDMVTCSSNAASKGGSQIWLKEGEQMTVDELLRATAIGSANDAATLLGEYISGSEEAFISLMNERALQLGMKNTCFVNATGLDDTTDEHLTTARDIAIMSRELLKYSFITKYTTVWMDSLRGGKTELVNTNKLVRFYDGTTGLKTGTTAKAGCCISASARRDDLHLIAVVMGSPNSNDRFNAAKTMLTWGFSNYTVYTPEIEENEISSVPVTGGLQECVDVVIPDFLPLLIKKDEVEKVRVEVELCENVEAPVLEKQALGKVSVYVADEIVKEYKILSAKAVNKINVFSAMLRIFNFAANGDDAYPFAA